MTNQLQPWDFLPGSIVKYIGFEVQEPNWALLGNNREEAEASCAHLAKLFSGVAFFTGSLQATILANDYLFNLVDKDETSLIVTKVFFCITATCIGAQIGSKIGKELAHRYFRHIN